MGSTPSSEEYFEKTVEQSVVAAVLRAAEPDRRQFLTAMGATALLALIAEVLSVGATGARPNRRPPPSLHHTDDRRPETCVLAREGVDSLIVAGN